MEVTDRTSEALERFEFCAKSADMPLTVEEIYPIGKQSIGFEGWWRPTDGHILDILTLTFKRYFWGYRVSANIRTEEDGWYKYTARMTLRS